MAGSLGHFGKHALSVLPGSTVLPAGFSVRACLLACLLVQAGALLQTALAIWGSPMCTHT